jgi:hypothetical protein
MTSTKVMKASRLMASMKVSKLAEMTHERRLPCEGPPLLRRLKIIPRQRRTYRRRLSRLMPPLLRRCECLRADSFLKGWFM